MKIFMELNITRNHIEKIVDKLETYIKNIYEEEWSVSLGDEVFFIDTNHRKYQGIDAYLSIINDGFALFGLYLYKEDKMYYFLSVEKKCNNSPIYIIKNTPIFGDDHMLGSINLDSLNTHADGSYGDHILRDPTSGRYYSTPVYDNYNENSEA